jgi:hypothetical protein
MSKLKFLPKGSYEKDTPLYTGIGLTEQEFQNCQVEVSNLSEKIVAIKDDAGMDIVRVLEHIDTLSEETKTIWLGSMIVNEIARRESRAAQMEAMMRELQDLNED